MQDLINHAAIERAASFVFTGARARYCLMGLMATAILAAIGAPLAAIWLGLALLVDETCKAIAAHYASLPAKQADMGRLAIDIVAAASFAAAPALVWPASGPLAIAMACALAAHGALSAEPRRALGACAPYALLGLWFALDGAAGGALGPALIGLACVIYLFANALHHANRAANARRQDAEWVRQLNMSRGDNASAAWEINFQRGELFGGDTLARLIGQPVCYRSLVESGCFAAPADRTLALGFFAPSVGPMRRVAIEHDLKAANGASLRVRHQGVLRTDPDGAPVRLSCTTHLNDMIEATSDTIAIVQAQAALLRTLRNETSLSLPIQDGGGSSEEMRRTFAAGHSAIEQGVSALTRARDEAETANLADAAKAQAGAAAIDAAQGPADGPLVIVIEDEPDARELAARALTRAGFRVQGVGGGEAGLMLARSQAPALVLLDIFLPDRSGWRVLQSLKQDPLTRDIPVVVLSVNEDRAQALALGAAEHIVKPTERDKLAATVMRYARRRTTAPHTQTASAQEKQQAG